MANHTSHAGTAFINLAYVDSNEELYLGLLAGLAGFGLVPVAALHDPGSDPQLSRIYRLIEKSVAQRLKSQEGWSSVFLASPFKDLRILAATSAAIHVPGLKSFRTR